MPRVKCFNESEVLAKAQDLFWKKGFHATSMQDLVDYLGINRASIYDTFGGKKDLFLKAFKYYRESNTKRVISFFEEHREVRAGLAEFFRMSFQSTTMDCDKKGCFVVNVTTELSQVDEEVQEQLFQNKKSFEELFYQYLMTGVKTGELSPDKDYRSISRMLYTFNSGLKVIAKIEKDESNLQSTVDNFLELI